MRPLPDIDNVEAMRAWGRRSALMSAHREAREALRDACTAAQGADLAEIEAANASIVAANRLIEIAGLWEHVK